MESDTKYIAETKYIEFFNKIFSSPLAVITEDWEYSISIPMSCLDLCPTPEDWYCLKEASEDKGWQSRFYEYIPRTTNTTFCQIVENKKDEFSGLTFMEFLEDIHIKQKKKADEYREKGIWTQEQANHYKWRWNDLYNAVMKTRKDFRTILYGKEKEVRTRKLTFDITPEREAKFEVCRQMGWMEKDSYIWIGNKSMCVYLIAKMLGITYNKNSEEVKGDFPKDDMKKIFGIKNPHNLYCQAMSANKPQPWRNEIDELFRIRRTKF